MKRKLQSLCLFLVLLLTAGRGYAYDAKIGGIYYNLNKEAKTAEVTSSDNWEDDKYSGDIIIPSSVSYEGVSYTVVSIGEWAFYGEGLTSIDLPGSVTSIGNYAFSNCTSLTEIEIPTSVTSMGFYVFEHCDSLTSAVISSSEIGDCAFSSCSALTSVVMHSSVTSIGFGAFGGCTSLTSIDIPSSVTSIGSSAFECCI